MDAAVTEAAQATATKAGHMAPKATASKVAAHMPPTAIASKGKSQAASTDIAAINAAISNTASKGKSQDLHGDNQPTVVTVDITASNYAAYHAATHTTKGKKGNRDMCNQMHSTLMQSDHNDRSQSHDIKGNSPWIHLIYCLPCSSSIQKYSRCTHKERKLEEIISL
jgi:hypothetical protein